MDVTHPLHPNYTPDGAPARKDDADKLRMSLVLGPGMGAVAAVMTFGARKYAAHNYRKGLAYSRLLDAAGRHLLAFTNGENTDPESGLSHIAHLGACSLMLLDLMALNRGEDDRWKP